jgi:O-antigen ligase
VKTIQLVLGLVIVGAGLYLALHPQLVADALGKPNDLPTRTINLRASYGGTLMGIGAFTAWFPGPKPWSRMLLGLLGWAMAGIAVARLIGFAIDGSPDTRQYIWITAEVVLAAASVFAIRRLSK